MGSPALGPQPGDVMDMLQTLAQSQGGGAGPQAPTGGSPTPVMQMLSQASGGQGATPDVGQLLQTPLDPMKQASDLKNAVKNNPQLRKVVEQDLGLSQQTLNNIAPTADADTQVMRQMQSDPQWKEIQGNLSQLTSKLTNETQNSDDIRRQRINAALGLPNDSPGTLADAAKARFESFGGKGKMGVALRFFADVMRGGGDSLEANAWDSARKDYATAHQNVAQEMAAERQADTNALQALRQQQSEVQAKFQDARQTAQMQQRIRQGDISTILGTQKLALSGTAQEQKEGVAQLQGLVEAWDRQYGAKNNLEDVVADLKQVYPGVGTGVLHVMAAQMHAAAESARQALVQVGTSTTQQPDRIINGQVIPGSTVNNRTLATNPANAAGQGLIQSLLRRGGAPAGASSTLPQALAGTTPTTSPPTQAAPPPQPPTKIPTSALNLRSIDEVLGGTGPQSVQVPHGQGLKYVEAQAAAKVASAPAKDLLNQIILAGVTPDPKNGNKPLAANFTGPWFGSGVISKARAALPDSTLAGNPTTIEGLIKAMTQQGAMGTTKGLVNRATQTEINNVLKTMPDTSNKYQKLIQVAAANATLAQLNATRKSDILAPRYTDLTPEQSEALGKEAQRVVDTVGKVTNGFDMSRPVNMQELAKAKGSAVETTNASGGKVVYLH